MARREESGMKKIMAILGICCLLAGGGLIVGGFAANGWKSFEPTYEKKLYQSEPSELSGVKVQTETVSVAVEEGVDEKLTVEYYVKDKVDVAVKEENGILSIVEKSTDAGRLQWIYRFAKQPVMRITLPKQEAGSELSLEMKSYTSDYSVSGIFGAVQIDCGAGNVKLNDALFTTMKVTVTAGNVSVTDVVAEKIRLLSTTGNIKLSDVKTDDFYAKCTTGNLVVTSAKALNFTFEATTGNAKLNDLDAEKTEIDVTTGNVRGTFVGKITEYSLQLSSTTGNVSPANRVTENGKIITIDTTTGNINLTFTED